MSYIIALTGGICSGKTTISNIFSKLPGVSVIDSDIIAQQITQIKSSSLSSIKQHFGKKILLSNGTLDRIQLKRRIFFNSSEKKWIENLLHPLIHTETQKKIHNLYYKSLYIVWVVPLLIEKKLQKKAHRTLIIDVHPDTQLNRLINRDNIDKQYAKKILLSQSTRQHRLKHAHDIIVNDNHMHNIELKILDLHQYYIKKIINNT